ncbi:hypothetical protein DFJ43DRAFT_980572, partial [Lentinula guzmanii]
KNTAEIAVDLDMPLRVVQRILHLWKEIGEVSRRRKGRGRAQILNCSQCQMLVALLEHSPDILLDELQSELSTQYGIDVSLATMTRTLTRLGYSRKKVRLNVTAAECLQHKVTTFIMQIKDEPFECLVCADEAAVNIHTTYRENGWS